MPKAPAQDALVAPFEVVNAKGHAYEQVIKGGLTAFKPRGRSLPSAPGCRWGIRGGILHNEVKNEDGKITELPHIGPNLASHMHMFVETTDHHSVEFAAPSGYVRLHQDRAQAASRAPSGPRFAQRTPTRDRIKPSRERRAASAGRAEGKVHRAGPKFAS